MGLRTIEHVVMATDSRFSVQRGKRMEPLLDVGQKLYVVGDRVGIVFAGDVVSAHDGINRFRRLYNRNAKKDAASVVELARSAFAFCYEGHMVTRRRRDPLYYLFALGCGREAVRSYYMGYENKFRPERRKGVQVVGDEDAKRVFLAHLGQGIGAWYGEGKLLDRVTDWAIAISGSLDAAADSVGGTVGGKVQLGVVSGDAYSPLDIVRLDYVAPPGEFDRWKTITAEGHLVGRPAIPRL